MTKSGKIFVVVAALVLVLAGLFGGPGAGHDLALLHSLHELPQQFPNLERAAILVTHSGSGFMLIPVALAAAVWLYWQRRGRDALMFLLVTLGGRLAVEGLKLAVGRPRPEIDSYPVYVTSLSFPSGHAANSMMTFLALALILSRTIRHGWIAMAIAASIVVGLSRPILGVHWPSDVIGGWSFGIAWTLACIALVKRDRNAA